MKIYRPDNLGILYRSLRFARRVQDLFGAEFDAEWLFDHPSLRELAAFLAAQDAQADAAAAR